LFGSYQTDCVVRKTVPCESFFNFFTPPTTPGEDDEPDEDIEERLELDYSLGEDIKGEAIPRAVDWFTGELEVLRRPGGF